MGPPVSMPIGEMKPGWQTTEFWLAVLVTVLASALLFAGKIDADAWKWAISASALGYTVGRGIAKVSL